MMHLYTATTPNGYKVSIALEELDIPYQAHNISLVEGEQKQPDFLRLNPNGRVPAIVDEEAGVTVFESGAILIYLAEKAGRLLPAGAAERSQVIQWLMLQMAGIGPMQGQAVVFYRYFEEKLPAAIARFQHEAERLYGVLDKHLQKNDFLAGEYSVADIAVYPWYVIHSWAGLSLGEFRALARWAECIGERPAVKRGMAVPGPLNLVDADAKTIENTVKMARTMLTR